MTFEEVKQRAEAGDESGQNQLALMYLNGNGVDRDAEQAIHWFTLAANQGNRRAQFNLGSVYREGQGVEKDINQAISWFKKSAEHGLPEASHALGLIYELGDGIDVDESAAREWYMKGAKSGYQKSQSAIGVMLGKSELKSDNIESFAWLYLAHKGAPHELLKESMGVVLQGLTEEERQESYQLTHEYTLKYFR